MRYHYLILLILISLLGCSEFTEGKKTQNINTEDMSTRRPEDLLDVNNKAVVFYNVENLFDTKDDPNTSDDDFTPSGYKKWTSDRYYKKIDDLIRVFSSIDEDLPVLIGLAEIENRKVLQDLIRHRDMQGSEYSIIHEESPDTRGIDVALIIDKNRFSYIEHESIRIDFPWDKNIKTRDILYVKGAFNTQEVAHIFVTHWPSRRDGISQTEPKRLEVAGKLRERIDLIFQTEENPKILIMGDFNDAPMNKSLEFVLKAKAHKDSAPTDLYNLSYAAAESGMGSLVHDGQWEMLDQMICSADLLKKDGIFIDDDAEIFDPHWILYKTKDGNKMPNKTYGGKRYYGGYSDHLPVFVTLKQP